MNGYTYDEETGEIDGEFIGGMWYSLDEIESSDEAAGRAGEVNY